MKNVSLSKKKNHSRKREKNDTVEREAKSRSKLNESRKEGRLLIKAYGENRQGGNRSPNPDANGIDLAGTKKPLGPQPSNFRRGGNDD